MTGHALAMPRPEPVDGAAAADCSRDDVSRRLGALFDAHHQRLYRLARRLSRDADDARDLVQETFLRAARSPGSIPDGASREEAWLVRVLINICRDRWRKTAVRSKAHAFEVPDVAGDNPESTVLARTMIWRALNRLAPRRRAILVMYELEGAEIPAIARLLGVAPVTVRWHLSRGRRELARQLQTQRPSRSSGGRS